MSTNRKSNINSSEQSELAELILDVTPRMMQILREEMRQVRGDRLSVPQFRVLASINRGITQNKQIAERLGVSEAAISRMIDTLVNEQLVKKGTSRTDRRQANLTLTTSGSKLFNCIKNSARINLESKIQSINTAELEAIINGLKKLKNNILVFQKEIHED